MIRCFSAVQSGISAIITEVEAGQQKATPQILLTGLPGEVIKESRERIRACLSGFGFRIPTSKTVIHFSPATTKKQGSQFDLAIAVGLLAAEGHIPREAIQQSAFLGELSLDGRVQPVQYALSLIKVLEQDPRIQTLFLSEENRMEAALVGSVKARVVTHLGDLLKTLKDKGNLPGIAPIDPPLDQMGIGPTLDEVQGLALPKRALMIAIAGRHHLLLAGSPGTGKSFLASVSPSLQPALSRDEFLELASVHDLAPYTRFFKNPTGASPFRAPHHSSPASAILGGGSGVIRPGEISLAHHGILFLDELPEFRRDFLEGLREPMQNGSVAVSRTGASEHLPARATIIGAMNPCPCGLNWEGRCLCTPDKIRNYQRRISGPLLDRFALFTTLTRTEYQKPLKQDFSHPKVSSKIQQAVQKQRARYQNVAVGTRNGDIQSPQQFPDFSCDIEFIKRRLDQLSLRRIHHTIKVARTIADLENADAIGPAHLEEAWSFRCPCSLVPSL